MTSAGGGRWRMVRRRAVGGGRWRRTPRGHVRLPERQAGPGQDRTGQQDTRLMSVTSGGLLGGWAICSSRRQGARVPYIITQTPPPRPAPPHPVPSPNPPPRPSPHPTTDSTDETRTATVARPVMPDLVSDLSRSGHSTRAAQMDAGSCRCPGTSPEEARADGGARPRMVEPDGRNYTGAGSMYKETSTRITRGGF